MDHLEWLEREIFTAKPFTDPVINMFILPSDMTPSSSSLKLMKIQFGDADNKTHRERKKNTLQPFQDTQVLITLGAANSFSLSISGSVSKSLNTYILGSGYTTSTLTGWITSRGLRLLSK